MVTALKPDVIFFEAFEEEQRLLKQYCPPNVVAEFTSKTIQESSYQEAPCSLISIRTQSKVPLSWANDLDGILTRSTGFEHLLRYQRGSKASTLLGYLPSYCSRAVTEQALLMILNLLRKAKTQQASLASFHRDGLTGFECFGKKILVVGVGRIGAEIVDIAQGLHMDVAGVDIDQKHPLLAYKDLSCGLAWADIVVCACSLTPLTQGMLGYAALKALKPGSFFINIARGEISPLKDLKRLLDEKILGGLGLDVYEDEELVGPLLRREEKSGDNESISLILELEKRENVIMTPHNAFNTYEALERKAKQSMESVKLFLEEKKFSVFVPEKE